jgi:hypothetical protein
MAQQTKQQAAISFYQQNVSANQQLLSIYATIKALVTTNTDESYGLVGQNFPTAAVNADGSIGTADASPNVAHPITLPAGAPLNKSYNDLTTGVQNLVDFIAFMENAAVSTSPRRVFAQNLQ